MENVMSSYRLFKISILPCWILNGHHLFSKEKKNQEVHRTPPFSFTVKQTNWVSMHKPTITISPPQSRKIKAWDLWLTHLSLPSLSVTTRTNSHQRKPTHHGGTHRLSLSLSPSNRKKHHHQYPPSDWWCTFSSIEVVMEGERERERVKKWDKMDKMVLIYIWFCQIGFIWLV